MNVLTERQGNEIDDAFDALTRSQFADYAAEFVDACRPLYVTGFEQSSISSQGIGRATVDLREEFRDFCKTKLAAEIRRKRGEAEEAFVLDRYEFTE